MLQPRLQTWAFTDAQCVLLQWGALCDNHICCEAMPCESVHAMLYPYRRCQTDGDDDENTLFDLPLPASYFPLPLPLLWPHLGWKTGR